MKTPESKRSAWRLAPVVTAGASVLAVAGALAVPAMAQAAPAPAAGAATARPLHVTRIAYGEKLHHKYLPHDKGSVHTEALAAPDDITQLGRGAHRTGPAH